MTATPAQGSGRWEQRGHADNYLLKSSVHCTCCGRMLIGQAWVVGARVYHLFTGYKWSEGGITGAFEIWKGGLSIWGAVLGGLIVRGIAIEYRSKVASDVGRAWCDRGMVIGSLLPALLLGVAFADLIRGLKMDAGNHVIGGFWDLVTPFGKEADLGRAGKEAERARRMLERYAPEGPGRDANALAWADWWRANADCLFFGEAGGYRWYLDPLAKVRVRPHRLACAVGQH